jgi:hypothetical protein
MPGGKGSLVIAVNREAKYTIRADAEATNGEYF